MKIMLLVLLGITSLKAEIMSFEKIVICSFEKEELVPFVKNGFYRPQSLETEGFVHCCKPSQLEYVSNKFFKKDEYILLISNQHVLGEDLVYENDFPHLYRELKAEDITDILFLKRDHSGRFILPSEF